MGCLFLSIVGIALLSFIFKFTGYILLSIFSNPLIFILIVLLVYIRRKAGSGASRGSRKKQEEIEYEFIDEEDPEN